jgi:ATP adenylyltransferase
MQTLFTPWRYSYITATGNDDGCFLCRAAERPDDPESLVVLSTEHHVVLLNRHPYSNGHAMIAPRAHLASPELCDRAARDEFWPLVLRVRRAADRIWSPHGFNLGLNLGSAAGAGVPEHFHFHVVPRWSADTNFMTVVGEARVVPEELEPVRSKYLEALAQEEKW